MQKKKNIPFVVIDNMKCIKHCITLSRFPKLWFVKELQGVCEFNEKQIIN